MCLHQGLEYWYTPSTEKLPLRNKSETHYQALFIQTILIQILFLGNLTHSQCHLSKRLSFVLRPTTWNLVASNPFTAAFSHFWEKVKITLNWKKHQKLLHATVKYVFDEWWRKNRNKQSNANIKCVGKKSLYWVLQFKYLFPIVHIAGQLITFSLP